MILFRRPYIFAVLSVFFIYLVLAFSVSGFYNTLPLIFKYAQTVNWIELGISLIFSLIIGALVSLNIVVVYIKNKERRRCNQEGTLTAIGTAGGLAAGICPLCVTGLFPLILGLFGITFTFASLPFKGLEVQVVSILLLSLSFWMLVRRHSFTTFK